jgi:Protein of unknown function (DUF3558)
MKTRIPISIVSSTISLLLLAVCGGSGAPEPAASSATEEKAATTVDVCGLLTSAEIEQALGKAPSSEPKAGSEGMSECSWPSPEGASPLVHLVVSPSGQDSWEAFVLSYQSEFGGEEPPPEYFVRIEGLGSWAVYRVDDNLLEVHAGDRTLEVRIDPPGQDGAEAIARKALSRLH